MQVSHGCDGQPTEKLIVEIPEGVIDVNPVPKSGWTLETVRDKYAQAYDHDGKGVRAGIKVIIWTGALADAQQDAFAFSAYLTDGLPTGNPVCFPTTQECPNGERTWGEIPAEGQNPRRLTSPAPSLTITAPQHRNH